VSDATDVRIPVCPDHLPESPVHQRPDERPKEHGLNGKEPHARTHFRMGRQCANHLSCRMQVVNAAYRHAPMGCHRPGGEQLGERIGVLPRAAAGDKEGHGACSPDQP